MQCESWAGACDATLLAWPALHSPPSVPATSLHPPKLQLLAKEGHSAETKPEGPLALVLLPTRELAQQVAGACRDLRKYSGLRSACITGGVDKGQQLGLLAKKVRSL